MRVSRDQKFWQDVIDKYYTKYYGIAAWHKQLIREAQTNGRLTIPSGRYYPIAPDYSKREPWPLTIIKNYKVQGFGAELVMLARLRAKQLLSEAAYSGLLICTVHDSIVVDTEEKNVYNIACLLKQAVEDVPRLCKQIWNYDFSLPLTCEVQAGPNKFNMQEIKFAN
jgi:DNA polymerase I-like protein with 3'-5' exonuclease and polymerase domains